MTIHRVNSLQKLLQQEDMDMLALIAGPDLSYFCNLNFHLSERPVILIITQKSQSILFHPTLESSKVLESAIPLKSIPYCEDPKTWVATLQTVKRYFDSKITKIGIVPTCMRFLELQLLQKTFEKAEFVPATNLLSKLRMIKEKAEIEAIHKAVKIAETAMRNLRPIIAAGQTEKEIAAELVVNLLRAGSEPNLPFMPIVASGPNSANPHAVPSERKLENGDLLIIDWGARYQGYISDITRTFAIGNIEKKLKEIADVVLKANQAARGKIKPGYKASEIDFAARELIARRGYADCFIHRTGHGIGLEAHESPFISQSNEQTLEPGMAFTIEPGIYIAGVGGARIEDNVVVTKNGVQTVTSITRELIFL
jgi:Xaa-Pro dipeptidase